MSQPHLYKPIDPTKVLDLDMQDIRKYDSAELWDSAASTFESQPVTINNGAGYATTTTIMTVDPLPLVLKVGTKLTFAGGGKYIITTAAAVNATTILSTSGLTGAGVVDDEAAPSGCYNWNAFNANIIENIDNSLKIHYIEHESGARVYLADIYDLSSNLTVGKQYRVTATLSYTGGSSAPNWAVYDSVTYNNLNTLTTTPTIYDFNFIANSVSSCSLYFNSMVAGNIITVDNLSLIEIEHKVIDHSKELNHADIYGASLNSGNYGMTELKFDGIDDVLKNGAGYQVGIEDMTVYALINPNVDLNKTTTEDMIAISNGYGESGGSYPGWKLGWDKYFGFTFRATDGINEDPYINENLNVLSGRWYLLVGRRNITSVSLDVNGTKYTKLAAAEDCTFNNLIVGAAYTFVTKDYANFIIAEVGQYSRELHDTELDNLRYELENKHGIKLIA